jgi:transposase-like protein
MATFCPFCKSRLRHVQGPRAAREGSVYRCTECMLYVHISTEELD